MLVALIQLLDVRQGNLALTYGDLGQRERALQIKRDVYSGHLKNQGEEETSTLAAACNYATSLLGLKRFEEAKTLYRKTMPVAQRVFGGNHAFTLKVRWGYAEALYKDPDATLDNLREAVATLEETERTARRVLGGAHPATEGIEFHLREARAALRARENAATGDPD